MAQRLKLLLRGSDLVARLGGDEFVIILPNPGGASDLDQLCSRLIECMQRPMHLDGNTLYLGVSIGVAWSQPGEQRADELLRQADIALYAAKAAGRNTWRVYEEAMGNVARDRRRYEQQLRDAMQQDQLELRYLPRFDVGAEQLYGFEAQAFWHHPERGELGGIDFIPVAEGTGITIYSSVMLVVMDSQPYTDVVIRMQKMDKNLYGAVYSNSKKLESYAIKMFEGDANEGKLPIHTCQINRDKAFDMLLGSIKSGEMVWAPTSEEDDELFVKHCLDMRRIQIFDEHQELTWSWVKTKDAQDHYHHSLLYLYVAAQLRGIMLHHGRTRGRVGRIIPAALARQGQRRRQGLGRRR